MRYEEFSEDGKKFIDQFKNYMQYNAKLDNIWFNGKHKSNWINLSENHYFKFDFDSIINIISFLYPNIKYLEQRNIFDFLESEKFFLQIKI